MLLFFSFFFYKISFVFVQNSLAVSQFAYKKHFKSQMIHLINRKKMLDASNTQLLQLTLLSGRDSMLDDKITF